MCVFKLLSCRHPPPPRLISNSPSSSVLSLPTLPSHFHPIFASSGLAPHPLLLSPIFSSLCAVIPALIPRLLSTFSPPLLPPHPLFPSTAHPPFASPAFLLHLPPHYPLFLTSVLSTSPLVFTSHTSPAYRALFILSLLFPFTFPLFFHLPLSLYRSLLSFSLPPSLVLRLLCSSKPLAESRRSQRGSCE